MEEEDNVPVIRRKTSKQYFPAAVKCDHFYRFLVVGDLSVGKTSAINNFLHDKGVKQRKDGSHFCQLELYSKKFGLNILEENRMPPGPVLDFNGIMLVYDISSRNSFGFVEAFLQKLKSEENSVATIIVGNTILNRKREVKVSTAKELALKYNSLFLEYNLANINDNGTKPIFFILTGLIHKQDEHGFASMLIGMDGIFRQMNIHSKSATKSRSFFSAMYGKLIRSNEEEMKSIITLDEQTFLNYFDKSLVDDRPLLPIVEMESFNSPISNEELLFSELLKFIDQSDVDGLVNRLNSIIESNHIELHSIVDFHKNTILHILVRHNKLDVILALFNHFKPKLISSSFNQFLNAQNASGNTIVHIMSTKEQIELFNVLNQYKLDLNIKNGDGWTGLHVACVLGNLEMVKIICKYVGSSGIMENDNDGNTPLYLATLNNNFHISQFLISQGASKESLNNRGMKYNSLRNKQVKHSQSKRRKEFWKSILLENVNEISKYLSEEPEIISFRDSSNMTALHLSCCGLADDSIVDLLIKHNSDVNACTIEGNTPIHIAAMYGKSENLIKKLMEAKGDINKTNNDGNLAIHLATYAGNNSNVEYLTKFIDSIDTVNKNNLTVLHIACSYDNFILIDFFVEKKANPLLQNHLGESCFHISAAHGQLGVMTTFLSQNPSLRSEILSQKDDSGCTPLLSAATYQRVAIINELLKYPETSIFDLDNEKETILHKLVRFRTSLSDEELNNISEIKTYADDDLNKIVDLVKHLISMNANIEAVECRNQDTPLLIAASISNIPMIKVLLESGADGCAKDKIGYSALLLACDKQKLSCVRVLLSLGNKDQINLQNEKGFAAIHIACEKGREDLVNILIEHKCDILQTTEDNETPLHIAAKKGFLWEVSTLLNYARESNILSNLLDAVNNQGETAFNVALINGHFDIASAIYKENFSHRGTYGLMKLNTQQCLYRIIDKNKITNIRKVRSLAKGINRYSDFFKATLLNDDKTTNEVTGYRLHGPAIATEYFKNQIYFCSRLQHENIIEFLGAGEEQEQVIYFNRRLKRLDCSSQKDNLAYILQIAEGISKGMSYLHSSETPFSENSSFVRNRPPIIHNALSSYSVFIDEETNSVRIGDFGVAVFESENPAATTPIPAKYITDLPPRYVAPELYTFYCSKKTDVFAFGILLWELFHRSTAFVKHNFLEIKKKILEGERPPISNKLPKTIIDLIRNCLDQSQNNRPHFSEISQIISQELYETRKNILRAAKTLSTSTISHAILQKCTTDSKAKIYDCSLEGLGCLRKRWNVADLDDNLRIIIEKEVRHYCDKYSSINCPNLLQSYCYDITDRKINIFTEKLDFTLDQIIEERINSKQPFTPHQIIHILSCVASAMKALADEKIAHGEIQVDNIFVRKDLSVVKLGHPIAKLYGDDLKVARSTDNKILAQDVYGFGMLISVLIFKDSNQKYEEEYHDSLYNFLEKLHKDCISVDLSTRPRPNEIFAALSNQKV